MKRSVGWIVAVPLLLGPAASMVAAAEPPGPQLAAKQEAQQFAEKAAQGNLAEVELGQMASDRAENEQVGSFAQRMVQDHTTAQGDLVNAAREAGVTLPQSLSQKAQAKMEELSGMSGAEFDRSYMSHMVQDHQKAVELYRSHANAAESGPISSYAQQTLPILEEHLEQAKQINNELEAGS